MTSIVLFHSAFGRRPAVLRLAEQLREAGHHVHTPDLFHGEVFEHLADGEAKRDAIGIPTLIERAMAAVAPLPHDLVYAGLSMGTAPAQLLAATRPGARGAVLLHGALPLDLLGVAAWPDGVPVTLHVSESDPHVDADGLEAFVGAMPAELLDHHVYPGEAHVFTDEGLTGHDAQATDHLVERVLAFLAGIDAGAAAPVR
jgi:dienelactone hydrolase